MMAKNNSYYNGIELILLILGDGKGEYLKVNCILQHNISKSHRMPS
jgi:hypothetical protein